MNYLYFRQEDRCKETARGYRKQPSSHQDKIKNKGQVLCKFCEAIHFVKVKLLQVKPFKTKWEEFCSACCLSNHTNPI